MEGSGEQRIFPISVSFRLPAAQNNPVIEWLYIYIYIFFGGILRTPSFVSRTLFNIFFSCLSMHTLMWPSSLSHPYFSLFYFGNISALIYFKSWFILLNHFRVFHWLCHNLLILIFYFFFVIPAWCLFNPGRPCVLSLEKSCRWAIVAGWGYSRAVCLLSSGINIK